MIILEKKAIMAHIYTKYSYKTLIKTEIKIQLQLDPDFGNSLVPQKYCQNRVLLKIRQ
jgi:hypothetical protein